jgi:uncharacterized membrane protein YidH (DUF202 family)
VRAWRGSACATWAAIPTRASRSELVRLIVTIPPIVLGGVLAWTSYSRWYANERAMRLNEPLPNTGPPRLLAAMLAVLALVIAVLVVANVVHA